MYIEKIDTSIPFMKNKIENFFKGKDQIFEEPVDYCLGIYNGSELLGIGSRDKNVFKNFYIEEVLRGNQWMNRLVSELTKNAVSEGYSHFFIFTKPENESLFQSLGFKTISKTNAICLMEKGRQPIKKYFQSIEVDQEEKAAIVMNANPFTLGHRYIVERAVRKYKRVIIFVVEEDRSLFSTKDRLAMVKEGVKDLNVQVELTGPYLISRSTFPTYFIKDRSSLQYEYAQLDGEIFRQYFVPRLNIVARYVGTEKDDPATAIYNRVLKHVLEPDCKVIQVRRKKKNKNAITGTMVRRALRVKDYDTVKELVPESTFQYLGKLYGFIT
ncbi:MAG: [citrate (pro-3S)-lyase] ligase [Tissierellia bacterium]|nr:[citrate (pro-3S)-lyase] ligase [Tissierellia bacterium]